MKTNFSMISYFKSLFLLLLFKATFLLSQGYTSFFTGNSTDLVVSPTTGICLMGGSVENDNAMKWFLQKANGGDILVIRTTGSNGYNNYFYSELGIPVNSVETLVITSVAGATNAYVLDKVSKAEAIWFAGGDQGTYVNYFKNNALEDALNQHINVKQGVIGGTSAGMAILGSHYYSALTGASTTSAQALANPYHASITLGQNDFLSIPFMQGVITDSHFGERNRQGRFATFIARAKQDDQINLRGIASDERIAVCVEPNGLAKVFGEFPTRQHFAYFVFPNCVPNNNLQTCQPNLPLSWHQSFGAYKIYKVPGTQTANYSLNLNDWTTAVGGTWLNWNVENGTFDEYVDAAPICQPLSIDTLNINELVVVNPIKNEMVFNQIYHGELTIFNQVGQQIYFIENFNDSKLMVDFLAIGTYFLRIKHEEKITIKKLIKK